MVAPLLTAIGSGSAVSALGGTGFLSSLGGLSGLGSFASGIGSLAGAFGGGGQSAGRALSSQVEAQKGLNKYLATNSPSWAVQGAKAAGLHPLTVLGQSPSAGPITSTSSNNKPDLAALGQGIDRALNAGRSETQRKLDTLALEKAQLSNDYLRTQIAGAQKAINNSGSTVPLTSYTLAGNDKHPPTTSKSNRGIRHDIKPATQLYRNANGTVTAYASEDLSESLEAVGIAGQADFIARNYLPFEGHKLKKALNRSKIGKAIGRFKGRYNFK